VIYWAGHGESTSVEHWLLSSDSANPASDVDGIQTAELAKYLGEQYRRRERAGVGDEDPWTVVVLDCCGAGLGVRRLAASLNAAELPRVWALLGTHRDEQAYTDRFAGALDDAIDSFAETDTDIPVIVLLAEVAERLGSAVELDTRNFAFAPRLVNPRYLGAGVTMSLDVRDELRRVFSELDDALRTHFVPKAQGAELGELAWYFTGRRAETRRIVGWLRDAPGGMLVVTGAAGSGKSALLGHVVAMSDSRLVAALRRAGQLGEIAGDQRAPDATFDAVVHLSALSLADSVAQLAAALLPQHDARSAAQLLTALSTAASPRDAVTAARTVLVDALDEARDPLAIARELLAPLARVPGVRVIVGTRRSLRERLDGPRPEDRELLDALDADESATLALQRDVGAVAAYAAARLRRSERSPYATRAQLADALADVIASYDQPFLFARLAVAELLQRDPIRPGPQLERLLSGGHRGLFSVACERLAAESPTTPLLLRALAFGLGRGVPRHALPGRASVWATVAEALADSPQRIGGAQIDSALSDAAAYIALDGEDGQSTYRLAHQTFAEHFGAAADDEHAQRAHAAITTRLLVQSAQHGWRDAHPYVSARLAEHAARGERLDELLADSDALDHLDQHRLAGELTRVHLRGTDSPPAAAAIIQRRDELAALPAHARAPARALAQLQLAAPAPDPPARSLLWPRWSTSTAPAHITLRGHTSWVSAVAFGVLDGRCVLASAGEDQTVRLWDPATASALGEPFATFADVHGLAIHDDTIAVATSDAVIVLDAHATRA